MRILILSNYPWKNNNSFGNTYSSIFGKIPNIEIAHVYMYDGTPDFVPNVMRYYQILEKDVIKSIFKKSMSVGGEIHNISNDEEKVRLGEDKKSVSLYGKLLSFGKRHHWGSMFVARELAWRFGRINYDGLLSFIKDFRPEIFFLPYSYVFFTNRLALYIKAHYDVPMVIEMAMDHYSLNRVSWNPLFWVDRFAKRKQIRDLVSKSEMMYVISKKLKAELETVLNIPCRVLYKTPDIDRNYEPYRGVRESIRFLYTGNLHSNRWKSLALLAAVLKEQNYGHLDIYTASPITRSINNSLNLEGYSSIHPPVSQLEVKKLQNEADVLVHAEAFDRYNKSLVRCAISTKIMDYLSVGRCILAIGPSDIASIEYLKENGVALVASNKKELTRIIEVMHSDTSIVSEFAHKGRDYSSSHLNAEQMRLDLYNSLRVIIDDYNRR